MGEIGLKRNFSIISGLGERYLKEKEDSSVYLVAQENWAPHLVRANNLSSESLLGSRVIKSISSLAVIIPFDDSAIQIRILM